MKLGLLSHKTNPTTIDNHLLIVCLLHLYPSVAMTLSVTVNVLLLIAAASSWKLLSRSFRQISRTHIAKMSLVNNYEESLMDDQRTPFSIGTVIGNEFENVVYNTNLTKSLRFSGTCVCDFTLIILILTFLFFFSC